MPPQERSRPFRAKRVSRGVWPSRVDGRWRTLDYLFIVRVRFLVRGCRTVRGVSKGTNGIAALIPFQNASYIHQISVGGRKAQQRCPQPIWTGGSMKGFVTGLAVGVGVGLLLAPEEGSETRKKAI